MFTLKKGRFCESNLLSATVNLMYKERSYYLHLLLLQIKFILYMSRVEMHVLSDNMGFAVVRCIAHCGVQVKNVPVWERC